MHNKSINGDNTSKSGGVILKKLISYLLIFTILLIPVSCLAAPTVTTNVAKGVISKISMSKDMVIELQQKLKDLKLYKDTVDGIYGKNTENAVIKFQKENKLIVDGVAGPITMKALQDKTKNMANQIGKNDAIKSIQKALQKVGLYKGEIDGIYGSMTKEAVMAFQKENDLTVDGLPGPATLAKLEQPNKDTNKELATEVVMAVQRVLQKLGLYKGSVDGIYGNKTKEALAQYKKSYDANFGDIMNIFH